MKNQNLESIELKKRQTEFDMLRLSQKPINYNLTQRQKQTYLSIFQVKNENKILMQEQRNGQEGFYKVKFVPADEPGDDLSVDHQGSEVTVRKI